MVIEATRRIRKKLRPLVFTPELDREILDAFIEGETDTIDRLLHDGWTKPALTKRAQELGFNEADLQKEREVARQLRDGEIVRGKVKGRTCLRCARVFVSLGPGNRLCSLCRPNSSSYLDEL